MEEYISLYGKIIGTHCDFVFINQIKIISSKKSSNQNIKQHLNVTGLHHKQFGSASIQAMFYD